jgi:tetratricopeptide (TPR) repeat protein
LATALLEVDRADEAVLILEKLIPADGEIEGTYMKALKTAKKTEQLIKYAVLRLDSDKLDEKSESVFIRALIDAEAYEVVLPHLRRVVQEKSATWASDYQEVLLKLNRNAERHDFLMARLGQENLLAEERRQLAFDLLELGDKKTAIATLKQLASGASIESQDVQQLFYLWAPYPDEQALDWIEHKAMNAAPKERARWFQQLVQRGGADRVVGRLETSENGIKDFMVPVYAEALAAEGEWSKLAETIRQAIATETDRMALGRYAALATQTKDGRTVEDVWHMILDKNPDDKDALRELGLILYKKNRFLDAERYLSTYKMRHGEDYEVNYIYAQVLLRLDREREAIALFQVVLTQLQGLTERHYHDIWIEAMTLNHLGRLDQSIAVFERLLEQRPHDLNLRADYASMLIDNGMLNEAQFVIEQQ